LGMERFRGPHSGANQVETFWYLLEQHELKHKVGYYTTNNATNNVTTMHELGKCFSTFNIA
ncbi:hypothetical protein K440DRAFT_573996, partial [Wilcoxina mikolae CBS 423.85]